MKDLIQKTIALLKLHVKNNLEAINQNQTKIKEILKEPSSVQRSVNFERHYEVNKSLLAENNDFINVQLTLINFLEKYKNSQVFKESIPLVNTETINDEEELFNLTISECIPFDSDHPNFNNGLFFEKLLKYYQDKEEYEKCQELLNLRNI